MPQLAKLALGLTLRYACRRGCRLALPGFRRDVEPYVCTREFRSFVLWSSTPVCVWLPLDDAAERPALLTRASTC